MEPQILNEDEIFGYVNLASKEHGKKRANIDSKVIKKLDFDDLSEKYSLDLSVKYETIPG